MEGANLAPKTSKKPNWNLYKDQEVLPKCIQQVIISHEDRSKTDKSLLNLNEHFIKEQAMEELMSTKLQVKTTTRNVC